MALMSLRAGSQETAHSSTRRKCMQSTELVAWYSKDPATTRTISSSKWWWLRRSTSKSCCRGNSNSSTLSDKLQPSTWILITRGASSTISSQTRNGEWTRINTKSCATTMAIPAPRAARETCWTIDSDRIITLCEPTGNFISVRQWSTSSRTFTLCTVTRK